MKFEDSKYFKILKHHKVEKPYGVFYFFDHFTISEIHEGIDLNIEMIDDITLEVINFYKDYKKDKPTNLVYISNKVNSYSLDPNSWKKVEEKYGINHTRVIITYNNWVLSSALIEKKFSKSTIKCCDTLDEGIKWTLSLNE